MVWKMWKCEKCGWEVTDGWLKYDYETVGNTRLGIFCFKCATLVNLGEGKTGVAACEYLESYIYATEGHLQIMGAPYINPIHSDSLAMSPDQVAQHRKEFPNIEIDDQCRPVFTHQKTHQKYMDKCGIVKSKQKIRKRGKIFTKTGD